MKALSEDVAVPRKYGPLIERGISLREIRAHNRFEIMLMLAAVSRHSIIQAGQQITEDMRKKDPMAMSIYSKYMSEMDKLREQRGDEIDG